MGATGLPPNDVDWKASRITLSTSPDGTMSGTAVIGGVDYHVRAWRREGAGQVVFEAQPVTDAEFEHIAETLSRKARG